MESNNPENLTENISKTPKTKSEYLKRRNTLATPESFQLLKPKNNNIVPGVLNLSLQDLFSYIEKDHERTYLLKVSYVEIYNENVYDLLQPRENLSEPLQINEDPIKGNFFIKGVFEETVNTIDDVLTRLEKGEENRHYAQTVMNHTSSRSHTVFRLIIKSFYNRNLETYKKKLQIPHSANINHLPLLEMLIKKKPKEFEDRNVEINDFFENVVFEYENGTLVTDSLLNYIDLGGSEKVSNLYTEDDNDFSNAKSRRTPDKSREKSKSPIRQMDKAPSNVKERVKEGQYINKSLFFLTQVLAFRTENNNKDSPHIPYRNSSLTKILKSSLSGRSKTLIVCCVTPVLSQFDHTMSTLRFGTSAKRCMINKKIDNYNLSNEEEIVDLKALISDYEKKIEDCEKIRDEMEALKLENQKLRERLKKNNAKNALIYLKNLPKSYKKEFLDQIREDIAYLPSNGMVFMTQNNKKYGLIDPLKKEQSLKNNWQELIFDYQGTFALSNFKFAKEINKILLEKIEIIKQKMEIFLLEFTKKNCNEIEKIKAKYQNIIKLMNIRFNQLAEETLKLSSDFLKAQKRLEIFEKYENLSSLNNNELEKLEKHLLRGFDIVKDERFRRKYEKNQSQMAGQSQILEPKEKIRKKLIENMIDKFLDFEEINEELDFDIDEDFVTFEEKDGLLKMKNFLREKIFKLFDEIFKDASLQKKIANLKEYDSDFHQRFELNIPEKKYEELGFFEDTISDSMLSNFIEDKEFLGENLHFQKKNSEQNECFQIVSPLEKPRYSLKKENNQNNSYENLFGEVNNSFKNNANKEIFDTENDNISFERSSSVKLFQNSLNQTYKNQKMKNNDQNKEDVAFNSNNQSVNFINIL